MFKIATWNVNSIKIRLEQVLMWMDAANIDILALQETKIVDEDFPQQIFTERGFHVVFRGQKSYNGVAIISRLPLMDVVSDVDGYADPQRRILAATIGNIRLINLYVPNGSEVGSEKFIYKLNWLEKITHFIQQEMIAHPYVAVVGDFNIAPEDRDVHDPAEWAGGVMVSAEERQAYSKLIGLGLSDSFRSFCQDSVYSWWDYRAASFRRNRGLRIDHILLSKDLHSKCQGCEIDAEPRKMERPSDHAPVWALLTP